jgi:hypothetical protein
MCDIYSITPTTTILLVVYLNHLTGITVDISVLLRFHFWKKLYYKQIIDPGFPSKSVEACGHIVGISVTP